jgi:hypothetical protein
VQVLELRHGADLLVATPGRLLELLAKRTVSLARLKLLVRFSLMFCLCVFVFCFISCCVWQQLVFCIVLCCVWQQCAADAVRCMAMLTCRDERVFLVSMWVAVLCDACSVTKPVLQRNLHLQMHSALLCSVPLAARVQLMLTVAHMLLLLLGVAGDGRC